MTMQGLNYYTKDEVNELINGGGSSASGFMKKSVYDTNDNGIVDNAEKVNGHTVLSNVPANAKFTDTTYTAGTGITISNGVISCTKPKLPKETRFERSESDLYDFLRLLDLSEMATRTSFEGMFYENHALTTVPLFDTSQATSTKSMFDKCSSLESVPLFNTSNVTDATSMFRGCSALVTVPQFNFSKVTDFGFSLIVSTSIFNGCTALSNTSLNNILASLAGATSYTGTKTLKNMGITEAQATTCTGLSNYSAFTAAGWSTGY